MRSPITVPFLIRGAILALLLVVVLGGPRGFGPGAVILLDFPRQQVATVNRDEIIRPPPWAIDGEFIG